MNTSCACTICFDPLLHDLQVTRCGHVYHRNCIYKWIDHRNTCPNCKQTVNCTNLSKLYLQPLDLIKEVLKDPSTLDSVAPNLVKTFTQQWMSSIDGKKGNDSDDDDEIEAEDDNCNTKQKSSSSSSTSASVSKYRKKCEQLKMQLAAANLRTKSAEQQTEALQQQIEQFKTKIDSQRAEKSKLNKQIHTHLKQRSKLEEKYFSLEDEVQQIRRDFYKKNKEFLELQERFQKTRNDQLLWRSIQAEIEENMQEQALIEAEIAAKKPKEQIQYLQSKLAWLKKEYSRMQKEREKERGCVEEDKSALREAVRESRDRFDALKEASDNQTIVFKELKRRYAGVRQDLGKIKKDRKSLTEQLDIAQRQLTMALQQSTQHISNAGNPPPSQQPPLPPPSPHSLDAGATWDASSMKSDECSLPTTPDRTSNQSHSPNRQPMYETMEHVAGGLDSLAPRANTFDPRATGALFVSAYGKLHSGMEQMYIDKDSPNPFTKPKNRKRNFRVMSGGDGRGGTTTVITRGASISNGGGGKAKRRRIQSSTANKKQSSNIRQMMTEIGPSSSQPQSQTVKANIARHNTYDSAVTKKHSKAAQIRTRKKKNSNNGNTISQTNGLRKYLK